MKTSIGSIGQIAINVHDLDRAVTFYRDVLQLPFLFAVPPRMAFFDCGGVRLMLTLPDLPERDHPASIIYYKVDDLGAAHAEITGRGAKIERDPELVARMPDHELWMSALQDSEGNVLSLMSEVRG
jgi:methylmalonyl-CoA/ethylmalonyl-CoA epimerase